MSAQTKPPVSGTDDQLPSGPGNIKGQEPQPRVSKEAEVMAKIRTTAEAVDKEALREVEGSIKEIRRAVPEPDLPADVADAGVVSPIDEAEKVVTSGTTLDLPIAEQTYKRGLHQRVAGRAYDKVVVGVSSLAALALWVGRLVKIAHKKTMRIIFKGGGRGDAN